MLHRRLILPLTIVLLVAMAPLSGRAQSAYTERLVRIPVHFPDEEGRPVTLDASVAIPTQGTAPFPAILLNHGFGGSRRGDSNLVEMAASRGYIVLRYSARAFGDTPGETDLVGESERQDMLDAIHWLNDPANVPQVWVDHVAQMGGSYGAGHGMALATLNDPAIKAVAPYAGYIDFYRGLAPYGVEKATIVNISYAGTVALPTPANRFSATMHRVITELNTGANLEDAKLELRKRSIIYHMGNIRVPMFFAQGWNDSFFEAQEEIEAFTFLQQRHIPTFLYVGGVGHPPSNPSTSSPEARLVTEKIFDFFDRYVKGIQNGFENQPPVEFSNASWNGPAWDGTTMRANAFPVGTPSRWNLCPGVPGQAGSLAVGGTCVGAPAVTLTNTYANSNPTGEPLSDGFLKGQGVDFNAIPRTWTSADTATFTSEPLTRAEQMTGVPRFGLNVVSSAIGQPSSPGPLETFQLDPRVYDVAPDGSEVLVTRGAYSENVDAPVGPHEARFDAFGFSYRFAAGHRIKVMLATNDAPYLRPASNPFAVVIQSGSWVELPGAEFAFPNA